ncbi:MAG: hypothetical protein RIB58_06090 [Phycisphaerales bacterium]
MAPAARTAKDCTRTPNKSGRKKPRGTVEADARGGKTTSVCEAPPEGSEPITPRAFLELYHERALRQLDACRGLLSCAEFLAAGPEDGYADRWVHTARDWIDSAAAKHATRLNGIFDALHRLAREDDHERELLPIQDGIEAALRRAHASRGAIPEGTRHEAAYRLAIDVREQWRQLQHGPADDAEQLQRAGRGFVRWMAERGGPGRFDELARGCKMEYEAAVVDLGKHVPAEPGPSETKGTGPSAPEEWVRSVEAAREYSVNADTIRKRAKREGWTTKRVGSKGKMLAYLRSDLDRVGWPRDSTVMQNVDRTPADNGGMVP